MYVCKIDIFKPAASEALRAAWARMSEGTRCSSSMLSSGAKPTHARNKFTIHCLCVKGCKKRKEEENYKEKIYTNLYTYLYTYIHTYIHTYISLTNNVCMYVCRWMVQLVMALQFLHDNNILHRDIKPMNIMLTEGGDLLKLG